MTGTEKRNFYSPKQQIQPEENGETAWADDSFDETYKEKEGMVAPKKIVWKNVVGMTVLHIGAVYGLTLVPSAKAVTLLWGGFSLMALDHLMA